MSSEAIPVSPFEWIGMVAAAAVIFVVVGTAIGYVADCIAERRRQREPEHAAAEPRYYTRQSPPDPPA